MSRNFLVMIALWTAALIAADAPGRQKLQRAIDLMQTKGDLPTAMALFREVASSTDRGTAAQALLYLAQCQERQGTERAQVTYQRIAKEFGDQREIAERARERLAVLASASVAPSRGLTARQLWTGPQVDSEGMPTADGRSVAVVDWDTGDLAVKDLVTGDSKRLMLKKSWRESTEFGEWPVLSPDQRQLVFAWYDTKQPRYQLRVAPNQVGAKPRILVDNPDFTYYQTAGWSPDGKSILTKFWCRDNTTQVAWVSSVDGTVKTVRSFEWRNPNISLSPDGRYIAYDVLAREDSSAREIHVLSADGSGDNVVVKGPGIDWFPVFSPDGSRLIFVSDRTGTWSLWAAGLRNGKADGSPQLLKADIGTVFPKVFTRSGSLLYFHESSDEDIYAAEVSATGTAATPMRISDSFIGQNKAAEWSPDGNVLAYLSRRSGVRNGPGAFTLAVRSIELGTERLFASNLNLAWNRVPRWFHDGRSIFLAASDAHRKLSLHKIDVNSGQISALPSPDYPARWGLTMLGLDDRTVYLVSSKDEAGPTALIRFDLESGKERVIYQTPARGNIASAALSPDGRTIALIIATFLSGIQVRELILMDSDGNNVRTVLRTPAELPASLQWGPGALAWSPESKYLYLVRGGKKEGTSEVHRMTPATASETKPTGITSKQIRFLSVNPAGNRLAFTTGGALSSELWTLDNVLPPLKPKP